MTAKATILRIRHSERKPEERAVRLLAAPHSQTRLEAHSCPSPSAAFPPHYGAPPPALGNTSSSSRTWALFQNPPPTDTASALLPHACMLSFTWHFQSSPSRQLSHLPTALGFTPPSFPCTPAQELSPCLQPHTVTLKPLFHAIFTL